MDLSLWDQSRVVEGRLPAALPGLGPWVGARVASPRCPILRPGPSSVPRSTAVVQFTTRSLAALGHAWLFSGPWPPPASWSARTRSPALSAGQLVRGRDIADRAVQPHRVVMRDVLGDQPARVFHTEWCLDSNTFSF